MNSKFTRSSFSRIVWQTSSTPLSSDVSPWTKVIWPSGFRRRSSSTIVDAWVSLRPTR